MIPPPHGRGFLSPTIRTFNKAIDQMERWNSDAYWKAVLNPPATNTFRRIPKYSSHTFFSREQCFLTDRILSNFNKILEEQDYECFAISGMPNNHWTCTRTSNWKRSWMEFGPYDPFDELSMQCNERKYGHVNRLYQAGIRYPPLSRIFTQQRDK